MTVRAIPVALVVLVSAQAIADPLPSDLPSSEPDPRIQAEPPVVEGGEVIVIEGEVSETDGGATTIDVAAGRRAPGSLGDAVLAAESLPGVARASAGSGDFILWGALPGETRILIDGVPVPALFHLGGFRSTFPDSLVADLRIEPAGFGVSDGRALGGIVRLSTRDLLRDGFHLEAGADLLDASAAVSVADVTRRGDDERGWSIGGAARVGYVDRLLSGVSDDIEILVPLSRYRNYAIDATTGSAAAGTSVLAFGATDAIERRLPTTDPAADLGEREEAQFHRLAVRHERNSGGTRTTASLWLGADDRDLSASFSAQPTSLSSTSVSAGARVERRQPIAESSLLHVGVELEGNRSWLDREGTLALPAREGDVGVFGQAPSDRVTADSWIVDVASAGVFGAVELGLFGYRLIVTPGARVEPIVVNGNRLLPRAGGGVDIGFSRIDFTLSPRIDARWTISDRFRLRASSGIYHQPPSPEDLSSAFGSTRLGPARSIHGVLGATAGGQTAQLELVGFWRESANLAARSPLPSPPVAEVLRDDGVGRTIGLQAVARYRDQRGLGGSVSYVISRARRRDGPDMPWRPSDVDQTHALVAVAGWQTARWELGARARVATGFPRTPVVGAYYDAPGDRFHPVFGENNGERLPAFAQLDLRVARRFRPGGVIITTYLDLLNVTARRNPEQVVYSHDFSERDFLTGLPPMAVAGVRVEY